MAIQLREGILALGAQLLRVLQRRKVQEVRRPMQLVVELLGVSQLQLVPHLRRVLHAHEVVVPGALK